MSVKFLFCTLNLNVVVVVLVHVKLDIFNLICNDDLLPYWFSVWPCYLLALFLWTAKSLQGITTYFRFACYPDIQIFMEKIKKEN